MILLLFLILGFILIFTCKNFKNIYLKTFLKCLSFALLISSLLEITIFNYRHYESLFFTNHKVLTNYKLTNITCNNNNCTVTNKEKAYIEIKNINEKVANIYLDLNRNETPLNLEIYFTDSANTLYLNAGKRTYLDTVKNSKYLSLQFG